MSPAETQGEVSWEAVIVLPAIFPSIGNGRCMRGFFQAAREYSFSGENGGQLAGGRDKVVYPELRFFTSGHTHQSPTAVKQTCHWL